MKVFSNTTPFIALSCVNLLGLMPSLFGEVVVNEKLGRNLAEYMGLQVTGTLGVLAKARTLGLIPSFSAAALQMRKQGIYFHEDLVNRVAARLGERH